MPLLKDIFDKYVLLPAGYWEYVRYANSNLEFNFFNIENSRIHIYTLSDSTIEPNYKVSLDMPLVGKIIYLDAGHGR